MISLNAAKSAILAAAATQMRQPFTNVPMLPATSEDLKEYPVKK